MFWKVGAAIIVVGWITIFLSSSGVLIGSEISSERDSTEVGEFADFLNRKYGSDKLICRYFVATSIIEVSHSYSETNTSGRAVCPRLVRF